jgi:hypothetical protein
MLPSKLPPGPQRCDQCRVATVTLTSTDWDSLWREVHDQHEWMLMGAGRRSWKLLCPKCKPQTTPTDQTAQ